MACQNNFRFLFYFLVQHSGYMSQVWCPMHIFDIRSLKQVQKIPLKNSKKLKNNFFIPKNSFSDQINPINDKKHDMPHFHIFLPK